MKKYISILIMACCSASILSAQGYGEGLLFSQNIYEGTARFQAMGGAFAALGGDFTTLSINPAGAAIYRSSELTFTPAFAIDNTSANYISQTTKDSKVKFGLGNLGWVSAFTTGQSERLVSLNVGVGFNKLQNNTQRFSANSRTDKTSLPIGLAKILSDDGVNYNDLATQGTLMEQFAWNTFLIDTLAGNPNEYIGATENIHFQQMGEVEQYYYRDQEGYVGEYAFNFGLNFSDKFYFGMTFGLQDIVNEFYEEYEERPVHASDFTETNFRGLSYRNSSYNTGTGYNLKFGAIVRPFGGLRLGAYIHTPTWMYLTNEWSAGMASHVFNNTYEDIIDDGYYEYKVNTPFKWGAGIAYTFGAAALISVDYEGADYSSITMAGRNERFAFVEDNSYLSKNARTVSNVRVGAEYRIQEIAIRAGYAYYQNPLTAMNDTHIGSVGLGYRGRYFFMDAAYSFAPSMKQDYSLYSGNPYTMSADTFYSKLLFTFGFRF